MLIYGTKLVVLPFQKDVYSEDMEGMMSEEDKGTKTRYGICSKILNTRCRPKKLKQTGQTQIRLLLMKQSDQGHSCLQSENQHLILEQKEKGG